MAPIRQQLFIAFNLSNKARQRTMEPRSEAALLTPTALHFSCELPSIHTSRSILLFAVRAVLFLPIPVPITLRRRSIDASISFYCLPRTSPIHLRLAFSFAPSPSTSLWYSVKLNYPHHAQTLRAHGGSRSN